MPAATEVFIAYCLASGSSANALLVLVGQDALLVDAGLGVRALKRELEARGVAPSRLKGVLLTHEHHDHVNGAIPLARKYNVPLVSTSGTLEALFAQDGRDAPYETVAANGEICPGPFGAQTAPANHDASDPVGFRVTWDSVSLTYTTDTGAITPGFRQLCRDTSLLAIESNHNIGKLRFGPYPDALKARIQGSRRHLYNNTACDLILEHMDVCSPVYVWLSHLSQTNNTPPMALNYWKNVSKKPVTKPVPLMWKWHCTVFRRWCTEHIHTPCNWRCFKGNTIHPSTGCLYASVQCVAQERIKQKKKAPRLQIRCLWNMRFSSQSFSHHISVVQDINFSPYGHNLELFLFKALPKPAGVSYPVLPQDLFRYRI